MEHSAKSNYERFKTNTLNLVPLLRGRIKAEGNGRGEDKIQLPSGLSEQVFTPVIFDSILMGQKGFPLFMRGNPKRTSTGCLALAGGGKLLGYFFDRHPNHLLSRLPRRSIGKDPGLEFPHGLSPYSGTPPGTLL